MPRPLIFSATFGAYKLLVCTATLVVSAWSAAYAQSSTSRQIALAGTTSMRPAPQGSDGSQTPEVLDSALNDADLGGGYSGGGVINRSIVTGPGPGLPAISRTIATSNLELSLSFNGLNHRDQRFANGGQQLSNEPPDQGLCVGNGYVLETVNTALRVYDTNGNALAGVTDLNTFYGYPAQFNRSTGALGPRISDPSCYFDPDTQRWFHVVVTLDRVGTTSAFAGPNRLDLAVSQTSNPLGAWNLYKIPTQNDGTEGTPNHHCDGGSCLGDQPTVGADGNGIYLMTNEKPLFAFGFHGAQIYAISKRALAGGLPAVTIIEFDTGDASFLLDGNPGYTVWPATSPAAHYATDVGGTQYFLSSVAVFNSNKPFLNTKSDNRLRVWALSNTQSLNTGTPALALRHGVINVETYAPPPHSGQKPGSVPLADCLNDSTVVTPLGTGCWTYLFIDISKKPPGNEVEAQSLDSGDSRMQQVVFADGKLWGALNTALDFGHATQAGIAYFVITPQISSGAVGGTVVKQGYLGLAGNNLTYPAVGVTAKGKGVIAFTLVGSDYFPSAAYAMLDAINGAGDIHIAAPGLGPDDGFTAYKAYGGSHPFTRWGDYGAAAVDGNSIWIASEYIGQTCTFAEFVASSPVGTCGGTRSFLSNWYTRISKISP